MFALIMWEILSPGSLEQLFWPRADILAGLACELLKNVAHSTKGSVSLENGTILSLIGVEDSVGVNTTRGRRARLRRHQIKL